eukprot:GEMP01036864.1.p2 GENE.GEMP01036864.1~~GEMP01036864.1.p2  ORF type:complete len:183 (-),score=11.91 GEMP01036864.1:1250-1798(-)
MTCYDAKMASSPQMCFNLFILLCAVETVERVTPEYGQLHGRRIGVYLVILTSIVASLRKTPGIGYWVPDAALIFTKSCAWSYVRSFVIYTLCRFVVYNCMCVATMTWLTFWYSLCMHLWTLTAESMESGPLFLFYVMIWMYIAPWIGAFVTAVTCVGGFFKWVIFPYHSGKKLFSLVILYDI